MSRAKRHHIVPKFYLNGFASETGSIFGMNLENHKVFQTSTTDACLEADYFSLATSTPGESDAYEKFLSIHEGQAAKSLGKVLAGEWPLGLKDRSAITTWLAYQHLRVRRQRDIISQTKASTIRLLVSLSGRSSVRAWIELSEGCAISDAEFDWEWADLIKTGGPDIISAASSHIQTMEEVVPVAESLIWNASWILIKFQRRSLLASDTPVSLYERDDHPAWSGVGLANAGGFVMPLSRQMALEIRFSLEPGDLEIPGSTFVQKALNKQFLNEAKQFLYFHPEDSHLVSEVARGSRSREVNSFGDEMVEFANLPGYHPSQLPDATASDSGHSMSLGDIEWPIRGRINPRPEIFD